MLKVKRKLDSTKTMNQYSSLTVAQLKDVLKGKGLSTQGLKAALVERLIQADVVSTMEEQTKKHKEENEFMRQTDNVSEVKSVQEATVTSGDTVKDNLKQVTRDKKVDDPNGTATEAKAVVEANLRPEKKHSYVYKPSPDEMKQAAVAYLSKKLHRAIKFGEDEDAIKKLKKQLTRVERFGLEMTTQLAQDLGFGKGPEAAVGKKLFHPGRRPSLGKRYKDQHR